jgi:predicted transcriptional regulator
MRVNRKIVEDFIKLQSNLSAVVDGFGLQHKRIYEQAGISKATYFRKLQTGGFDGQEMLKIVDAINK